MKRKKWIKEKSCAFVHYLKIYRQVLTTLRFKNNSTLSSKEEKEPSWFMDAVR